MPAAAAPTTPPRPVKKSDKPPAIVRSKGSLSVLPENVENVQRKLFLEHPPHVIIPVNQ